MTLRLAHDADESNITEFPRGNPRIIPEVARKFANEVEAGAFGDLERAVVILETDVGYVTLYWGDDISHTEAVGILNIAAHMATRDAIDSDNDE